MPVLNPSRRWTSYIGAVAMALVVNGCMSTTGPATGAPATPTTSNSSGSAAAAGGNFTLASEAILFSSRRMGKAQIYAMNPDGSGVTRLTQDAFNDQASARSKDGKSLLIASDASGKSAIYVMHADGSPRTALSRTSHPMGGAKWSPDGETIVFDEDLSGTGCYTVFKMNTADATHDAQGIVVDGSGSTPLTPASGDCAWSASWSPDGTKLAFGTTRDGNFDIYLMNRDGSSPTRLTSDAERNDAFPVFSPDGKHILFTSWDPSLEVTSAEVFVMNADGTGRTQLTANATEDSYPAWSPDGAKIVFQSGRDGNLEIYVMNSDGSGQTRLTNDPAEDFGAIWN